MFGIGMPEMILILAVALIVIGPKKLPDLAKSLGKAMGEFKRATSDLKESMQIDAELKEVRSTFDDIGKTAADPAPTTADPSEGHSEADAATESPDATDPLPTAVTRTGDPVDEPADSEPPEVDAADTPETDKG